MRARPAQTPELSPRAVARAGRREDILRAAVKVFAERGFHGAQVADIAREAGVAAGTVYLYFAGKSDLLASLFERTMREAIAEGRAAMTAASTPDERLRRLARVHLERLGRDKDLAVVFQVELRHSTRFMERASARELREYLGLLRDVIAEGQARGVFRSTVRPTTAAKILFGALDEMATNWVLSRRRYPLSADADAVVDLFLHGVKA